jgi:hypothetical protein
MIVNPSANTADTVAVSNCAISKGTDCTNATRAPVPSRHSATPVAVVVKMAGQSIDTHYAVRETAAAAATGFMLLTLT